MEIFDFEFCGTAFSFDTEFLSKKLQFEVYFMDTLIKFFELVNRNLDIFWVIFKCRFSNWHFYLGKHKNL